MLFRKILFPFSLLYGLIVKMRNYCYDHGIFRVSKFQTPIICIGNLSTGGTGKTPMVEYLLVALQEAYKIAVLSRGYKRMSKGFILAGPDSTVTQLGDEPYQIHSKFAEVIVAVDADRRNGISILGEKVNPDLILLDDAFQHRKVKAGLNILLTAYGKLYTDDWYLPTGNLRDSKSAADRAQLIVVTKCPSDLSREEQTAIHLRLRPKPHQTILFATLEYDLEFKGEQQAYRPSHFKDSEVTLVTGIADAKPLVDYLKTHIPVFEHKAYADHHFFTDTEIKELNSKEVLLTTEKDYMRLKERVANLFYIPVKHRFLGDDGEVLKNSLADFMKRYP